MAALLVAGCRVSPAAIPWDADVPPGGTVIYVAEHGFGICGGFHGCPTRIVQMAKNFCITEVFRSEWQLYDSKPCG